MLGNRMDINDRKLADEAMKASEERVRDLYEKRSKRLRVREWMALFSGATGDRRVVVYPPSNFWDGP